MSVDTPQILDILRRSMIARIATLSRTGHPNINPLYFVSQHGCIWLDTSTWTLAARNVTVDPRVSVHFEVEQGPRSLRVLRINGRASVSTDQQVRRVYHHRAIRKYVLTPGGICHYLAHVRQLMSMHRYHAQSAQQGQSCVIEVTPLEAEFLDEEQLGTVSLHRRSP
jgi:general stress protein 26